MTAGTGGVPRVLPMGCGAADKRGRQADAWHGAVPRPLRTCVPADARLGGHIHEHHDATGRVAGGHVHLDEGVGAHVAAGVVGDVDGVPARALRPAAPPQRPPAPCGFALLLPAKTWAHGDGVGLNPPCRGAGSSQRSWVHGRRAAVPGEGWARPWLKAHGTGDGHLVTLQFRAPCPTSSPVVQVPPPSHPHRPPCPVQQQLGPDLAIIVWKQTAGGGGRRKSR